MKYKTVRTYVDKEVVVTYVLGDLYNIGYVMFVTYSMRLVQGRYIDSIDYEI